GQPAARRDHAIGRPATWVRLQLPLSDDPHPGELDHRHAHIARRDPLQVGRREFHAPMVPPTTDNCAVPDGPTVSKNNPTSAVGKPGRPPAGAASLDATNVATHPSAAHKSGYHGATSRSRTSRLRRSRKRDP